MTVGDLYRQIRDRFRAAGLVTADLDARLLVCSVLGFSLTDLVLREWDLVPPDRCDRLSTYAKLRLDGMPVGRILGEREFYGRSFLMNEATLEPRPDTEILVDTVLNCLENDTRPLRFADIGTGTGIIAITLLCELPRSNCIAIDLSEAALTCASRNAERHGVRDHFYPVCGNYCSPLEGGLDWIVSNPPYIRTADMARLAAEVQDHDPKLALDGGPDGLAAYRQIVLEAAHCLVSGGGIAFEIGFDQGDEVRKILLDQGFGDVNVVSDLAGHDRVVVGRSR